MNHWNHDEERRITLTLLKPTQQGGQDFTVAMDVVGSKREEFYQCLSEYVKCIESHQGTLLKVNEVVDLETHKPCGLHLTFHGMNQPVFIQEFQQRAQRFIELSVRRS